jgi:hypothetical protein
MPAIRHFDLNAVEPVRYFHCAQGAAFRPTSSSLRAVRSNPEIACPAGSFRRAIAPREPDFRLAQAPPAPSTAQTIDFRYIYQYNTRLSTRQLTALCKTK